MHFDQKALPQNLSESILINPLKKFCRRLGKEVKITISEKVNQNATFKCCGSAISII